MSIDEETYLGSITNTDMADNDHIIKDMRNICARGNMLICSFKHCTVNVKITHFKRYYSNIYCCPMWLKFCHTTIGNVH